MFFLIDLYHYSKWLICIYNSHHTRMILNITFNKSKIFFKNDRKIIGLHLRWFKPSKFYIQIGKIIANLFLNINFMFTNFYKYSFLKNDLPKKTLLERSFVLWSF